MKQLNDSLNFIDTDDYQIIETMAQKYGMNVYDFGHLLSKKNDKVLLQIRFSEDELTELDRRAKEKKLARSKFCKLCFKKVLDENIYENLNYLQIIKDEKEKTEKINIYFNAIEYKSMYKLSAELQIPFSTLMRYFSLNIDL